MKKKLNFKRFESQPRKQLTEPNPCFDSCRKSCLRKIGLLLHKESKSGEKFIVAKKNIKESKT